NGPPPIRTATSCPNTYNASRLNARCSGPPCRNMYVTNVQGCARARSGTNPNVVRKRGSTKIVIWKRKTTRLATNSRRTQGVMPNIRCGPIYPRRLSRLACYSPAPTPRVPRQPADTLAQFGKLDPGGPCGLREQARPRHSGEGVRLQAKDVPVRRQPDVNPRVSPELERAVRRQRELLQLARRLRIELRRDDLLRHPGRVLALVVEQLVLGDDLPHRQGHVAEHAHREPPSRDELLDHHLGVVAARRLHGGVQALGVPDERHSHG